MGALGNFNHEQFCQALHKRRMAGEKIVAARRGAYIDTIYEGDNPDEPSITDNARRLAGQKPIKERLQELADYAFKLSGIDSNWAMLKLKGMADSNIADYLSEPDGSGTRFFDLRNVPHEKLALLSEMQIEDQTILSEDNDDRRILKTKLKLHDPLAALRLMADIAGWKAPTKIAPTDPSGTKGATLTLESLVVASFEPAKKPEGETDK